MIDLDRFKSLNDEHGHATGDQVLQWFGDLVKTKLRPGDIACRYGGEEFVVMMPSAPLTVSLSRAEDIRGSFTQLVRTASNNRLPNVTLSAVWPSSRRMRPVPVNFGGAPMWRCMRQSAAAVTGSWSTPSGSVPSRSGEPSRGWLPNPRVRSGYGCGVPRRTCRTGRHPRRPPPDR